MQGYTFSSGVIFFPTPLYGEYFFSPQGWCGWPTWFVLFPYDDHLKGLAYSLENPVRYTSKRLGKVAFARSYSKFLNPNVMNLSTDFVSEPSTGWWGTRSSSGWGTSSSGASWLPSCFFFNGGSDPRKVKLQVGVHSQDCTQLIWQHWEPVFLYEG